MRNSFIKARKKEIFTQEIKLVLFFFSVTSILLLSTYIFLVFKIVNFQERTLMAREETHRLEKQIKTMEMEMKLISKQYIRSEDVFSNNELLKKSIRNLFDLVPDKITLSKAELDKEELILYGKTPTREVYEYLLLAPLRSIFNRSYTNYYELSNGWVKFVSTNYLDTKEEEEMGH